MAKILHSGIGIVNSRGKINNEVHTRNRGGNVTRAYVIPTNTITPRKTDIQTNLAQLAQIWSIIPQSNRDEWNRACLRIRKKNVIGAEYYSSGFNMFMQQTFNILIGGGMPSGLPIAPQNWHRPMRASVAIPNLTSMLFTCSYTNGTNIVPANQVVIIRCSVGVSVGINYKRTGLIYIQGWSSGQNTTASEFYPDYLAELGTLTSGTKIFCNVFSCNSVTGQRSTPILLTAIVP